MEEFSKKKTSDVWKKYKKISITTNCHKYPEPSFLVPAVFCLEKRGKGA
jgi:hypothetical protein